MKTLALAVLTASLAVTSIAPAANAQSAPDFLQGINASPMTPAEMESVRGERVPPALIRFVARQVGSVLGQRAALKIEEMLMTGDRLPTYQEYRAVFGRNTAIILTLLPAALRPRIAG